MRHDGTRLSGRSSHGDLLGVRAHELSLESRACGLVLNRILQSAITVGRRVRNETAIGAGAVSVASAASELASKIFEDLSTRKVLLIGVGEMGALTARHMIDRGASSIVIANRTFARAEELASELSGTPLPLDRLDEEIAASRRRRLFLRNLGSGDWNFEPPNLSVERVLREGSRFNEWLHESEVRPQKPSS